MSESNKIVKDNGLTKPSCELRILDKKVLWKGFVELSQVTAEIPRPNSAPLKVRREIHHHGNGVAVMPIDRARNTALLVRQWRLPLWFNGHKERLLEAVAGIIHSDETPEACAVREAMEETGYAITKVRRICEIFPSPGTVTERLHLFLAEYDQNAKAGEGGGKNSEEEDIEVVEMSLPTLADMAAGGGILDAKTLILILSLEREGFS